VASGYPWSSAAAHCKGRDALGLLDLAEWREMIEGFDWTEQLRTAVPKPEISRIRLATHSGRPLASDSWLSKLEKKLGRRLRALPPGRPKKRRGRTKTATQTGDCP
jgi:putative transposase